MRPSLHGFETGRSRADMTGDMVDVDAGTGDRQRWTDRPTISADETIRVEMLVRSMAPAPGTHDAQVDLVETARRLEAAGTISDATLSIWGERLCRCQSCRETTVGREYLERIRAFEAWGERVQAGIDLPFRDRRLECRFTGTETPVIVPPRVTIAVYGDATVRGVFPCEVDGTPVSAAAGLERLGGARRGTAEGDGGPIDHPEENPAKESDDEASDGEGEEPDSLVGSH